MKMTKIFALLLLLTFVFSLASCKTPDNQGGSGSGPEGSGSEGSGSEGSGSGDSGSENTDPDNQTTVTGSEKIINVYLIAGQSNAVGYGLDTGNAIANSDERFVNGFENVLYYGSQERWSGSYPNSFFKPVKLGMGVDFNRSGAEIGIASAIADDGEMNAIIKCAWGATHLYPDTQYDISLKQGTWTSPSYIENNNVDLSKNELIGNMYNRFVDTVVSGLELLIEDGYTPVIKGVWWMQGEAEMFTYEMASSYKELYETLICDTRDMLSEVTGYDCSEVPFVCGLPKWNTNNSPAPQFQPNVRNAMTTVANELDNVGYVDCMSLTQHDDWHFDAAGQKQLGESFIACVKDFEKASDKGFNENISIDNNIELLPTENGMEFRANLTNYSSENGYEYGFIVVPTAKLIEKKITANYAQELKNAGVAYKTLSAKVTVEKIDENYSDIYFTAKLTDIAYEDLNTSYTAIAYIKGEYDWYLYSSASVGSSIAKLASRALYSTDGDKTAIKQILNSAINSLNGVPAADKNSAPDFEIIAEDSVNLSYSDKANEYKLVVTNSAGADYFVKYCSDNPDVVSVDKYGVLTAHQVGEANISVECAGATKTIAVSVGCLSISGVVLDGVISDGEYNGSVITASNSGVFAKFAGMIKDGKLFMSFELTHGAWSPISSNWWLNDNVEFKLNEGASHTVVFYDGVATFSSNISYGVSKTVEVDGKLVTTIELCVENIPDDICRIKVGMNGVNFGWLGAIWNDYCNLAYVSAEGILWASPVDLGNGIILDGKFDESVYTESVKNNSVSATANGADINIIGTLTQGGVLYGITVNHTLPPEISTGGSGDWYTFMNVEFHFNGDANLQFIATANNCSLGNMFTYCSTVQSGNKYISTFEIFIPYEAIGVNSDITSLDFTVSGWFEYGWCWVLNNSWDASHVISQNGIVKK